MDPSVMELIKVVERSNQLAYEQQMFDVTSIYENWTTWIVFGSILAVGLKFLPLYLWSRSVSSALGPWGQLLGVPQRSAEQLAADRTHSYRVWGSALSGACVIGGLILLAIGFGAGVNEGVVEELAIGNLITMKNATPGVVLLGCGVVLWGQTHKR